MSIHPKRIQEWMQAAENNRAHELGIEPVIVTPQMVWDSMFTEAPAGLGKSEPISEHKSEKVKELAEKWGLKLETIVATTCPYGDLNQHLSDTANCELGDECVYSGKPVTL
jgi:hypothetical protein